MEAYGWISYAAKSGGKEAAQDLEQLRKLLGDKIGQAEIRAREIETTMPKTGPAPP
ncbi:hypothetical protein BH09VER1_BH09VER1_55640 [soil metagenome]